MSRRVLRHSARKYERRCLTVFATSNTSRPTTTHGRSMITARSKSATASSSGGRVITTTERWSAGPKTHATRARPPASLPLVHKKIGDERPQHSHRRALRLHRVVHDERRSLPLAHMVNRCPTCGGAVRNDALVRVDRRVLLS